MSARAYLPIRKRRFLLNFLSARQHILAYLMIPEFRKFDKILQTRLHEKNIKAIFSSCSGPEIMKEVHTQLISNYFSLISELVEAFN